MAKRFNPSLIGAFVVGGIALFVAALFLFGSMDLFKEKKRWVTYFQGSVQGLTVGAPVMFRGVRVGTVTDILLIVDAQHLAASIPVYFEVERDRLTWAKGGKREVTPAEVVKAGMRARLAMQSLVTGQMYVELDLRPDTPANLVGADKSVPELPSIPSEIDVLKSQLSKLPLSELVADTDKVMQSLDRLTNSPEVQNSLKAAAATMKEAHDLITNLNENVLPLVRHAGETLDATRQTAEQASTSLKALEGEGRNTMVDIRKLAGNATGAVGDLRTSLRTADRALEQARSTLASVNDLVAADTASRQDIDAALNNLSKASSALRSFANEVERNPNALIIGR